MNGTFLRATLWAAACTVLAGCAREQDPPDRTAGTAGSAVPDSTFDPAEDRVTLPTSRIYYTLTSHDWYAHGQPLLHDGRAYTPEGMPISASLTDMTPAGEFQGVAYYVRSGDRSATVYVPVFPGYWQGFRLDPSAAAAAADDAAPADAPDSAAARD